MGYLIGGLAMALGITLVVIGLRGDAGKNLLDVINGDGSSAASAAGQAGGAAVGGILNGGSKLTVPAPNTQASGAGQRIGGV